MPWPLLTSVSPPRLREPRRRNLNLLDLGTDSEKMRWEERQEMWPRKLENQEGKGNFSSPGLHLLHPVHENTLLVQDRIRGSRGPRFLLELQTEGNTEEGTSMRTRGSLGLSPVPELWVITFLYLDVASGSASMNPMWDAGARGLPYTLLVPRGQPRL